MGPGIVSVPRGIRSEYFFFHWYLTLLRCLGWPIDDELQEVGAPSFLHWNSTRRRVLGGDTWPGILSTQHCNSALRVWVDEHMDEHGLSVPEWCDL